MIFDYPRQEQIPSLLQLWKSVFGDWNGFWETFLDTAFSPSRCRCILEENQITAALTWLDCSCENRKMAYIYAVVTHPRYRGQGLCRRLLADTHALLKDRGYAAALLVPAEPPLREMYEKLGYQTCSFVEEFTCEAGAEAAPLRAVGPEEFARLRRNHLPPLSVLQEEENLSFLASQSQFYAGDDFLMAAAPEEDSLTAMELLGNTSAAPGILRSLGVKKGSFRCPGNVTPFAMIHSLQPGIPVPAYLGFAFD